jgi:outer membrane murein-binding lipoprotein Lpp
MEVREVFMKRFFAVLVAALLLLPSSSFAVTQEELMQKIQELSQQLEQLKKQMENLQNQQMMQQADVMEAKEQAKKVSDKFSWLTIGGDYRFRLDSLKGKVHENVKYTGPGTANLNYAMPTAMPGFYAVPYVDKEDAYTAKNDTLFLNRFALNIKAQVTENIQVKSRILMYKAWGNDYVDQSPFFADRYVIMDGNLGHIPQDNTLRVDYAYATWSNIFELPIWFSIGRRPSTGGVPSNIRQNREKVGTAGVPALLVDYAFDGLTLGVAPDIDKLEGAYAKVCYGKGMDTGFRPDNNRMKDVQMIGINVVPYDTDNLHIEFQWQKAFSIFAYPGNSDPFGLGVDNKNIGDIDWWGTVIMGKIEDLGPGDLNLFASAAISKTRPNDNGYEAPFYDVYMDTDSDGVPDTLAMSNQTAKYGLLYDDPNFGGEKKSHSGNAIYLGARYDIKKTGTKIGIEWNRGSKYWLAFTPASDDLWTSKLATRGDVYEAYIIQELPETPISKFGKAYFRLGYQYYRFKYTGSGFWLGEPKKIDDLNQTDPLAAQLLKPIKNAQDIYFTFDVEF